MLYNLIRVRSQDTDIFRTPLDIDRSIRYRIGMSQNNNITPHDAELDGILSSLSDSVRPQDDFFRYVNGPWIDSYELPADKPAYGAFAKLVDEAEEHIRDILENSPETSPKSAALYNAYLDKETREKAGLDPIREDLGLIDTAQTKEDLTRALAVLNVAGGPVPFSSFVYADSKNPETNILTIGQGGLGLPDEAYYRENNFEPVRQAYSQMVGRLLTAAGYTKGDSDAQKQGRALLNFETRIASHHWDNVKTRDVNKTYNRYSISQAEESLPHFNLSAWLDSWQEAYDNTPAAAALPVDIRQVFAEVVVSEPDFLTGLDMEWDKASLEDLRLWSRVHVLLHWADSLTEELDDIQFDFFGKTLMGTSEKKEPWRRAVRLVDTLCGEEVGQEYVKRYFPASSKERMEKLVSNLIAAYRVSISHSTWLGEGTREKALEKLSLFTPMIGYTEHWRDYTAMDISTGYSLVRNLRSAAYWLNGYELGKAGRPVDKTEWEMTPQTVNAYYSPNTNVIVFPAAILQPPFFNPDADDATNYGGIGAVIGHEIGHGFDDQGSEFDGHGRLTSWWTEQDHNNFTERTRQLIAEYDQFTPAAVAEKYKAEGKTDSMPHVSGALTTGENIGDLSGVNIALKALTISLGASDDSAEEMDKALDSAVIISGQSALERFFLSYGHIWREKATENFEEQMLQIDPHSPAEFRVNGILPNVDRFYEVFNVQPEDAMYIEPGKRVHIW